MTDEPLRREIQQFRVDTKDDLADIQNSIQRLVSRDVHEAQLARIHDQISHIQNSLGRMDNRIVEWEKADKERRETINQNRVQDRRMVIGAILGVVASILVQVLRTAGAI